MPCRRVISVFSSKADNRFCMPVAFIMMLRLSVIALAGIWIGANVNFANFAKSVACIFFTNNKSPTISIVISPPSAEAQQITPEKVAAWIKEKRESRKNRDWSNAPYLNDQLFGRGGAKTGGTRLGTGNTSGVTRLFDASDVLTQVEISSFSEFVKIILLNKTEDGTHIYLIADKGMNGAIIFPLNESNTKTIVPTTVKGSFALSDDFYIVESAGQGAVIVDNKNNKVIFINAKTEIASSYDIQIDGAKSDAVVIDDYRFAVIYGSKLAIMQVGNMAKSGTFDISEETKSEPQSSEMKIIVASVLPSGAAMLVVDAPEWQKMYVYVLGTDGALELKGTWTK